MIKWFKRRKLKKQKIRILKEEIKDIMSDTNMNEFVKARLIHKKRRRISRIKYGRI